MTTVFDIHGGIHPPEEKSLSNPGELLEAGIPPTLVLPLSQHIGKPPTLEVAIGDRVKGGQLLAAAEGLVSVPLHAPTSGVITAIEPRPVPHPSGLENLCVELRCDGEDDWLELKGFDNWQSEAPETLVASVRAAGIAAAAGVATAVEPQPRFVCTLTLLLEWAQAVQFPGGFPAEERKLVLQALAMQAHRPGFKPAAGPVINAWGL